MRSIRFLSFVSGVISLTALLAAEAPVFAMPASPSVASSSQGLQDAISAAHFEEPLIAPGATGISEDAALVQSLAIYNSRTDDEDLSSLTAFLKANPHSPWAPAIWTNIGLINLHNGYFSRAIDAWQNAWLDGKDATDPHVKALIDRAVGELAQLYANLGKNEDLAALIHEIGNRPISGSATETFQNASEELALTKRDPRHLFICGPLALKQLLLARQVSFEKADPLQWYQAGPNGTNLAEVSSLADKTGFSHRLIARKPGESVPVPSIVHWKVGHFAAIVGEAHGRFHIRDSVFAGTDLWVTKGAIDAEASGYFLIPLDLAENNHWKTIDTAVAANVWGKGPTNSSRRGGGGDPDADGPGPGPGPGPLPAPGPAPGPGPGPGPAPGAPGVGPSNGGGGCGLCFYNIKESSVAVSLSDQPVGYNPPVGPSAMVKISYNQRQDSQPANFSFFNVSPKWSVNWLSYVTDDPKNPGANVSAYLRDSTTFFYLDYQAATGRFAAQDTDGSVMVRASTSPVTYRHLMPDGSVEIYTKEDGATSYPRRIFLSQVVDPQGNAVVLNYDQQFRLSSLTDATGRITTFSYELVASPLLITKITDPFGRSAILAYDGSARLKSITDTIGLTSSFSYDVNSLVNALTTPYGVTTFTYTPPGTSSPPRFVDVTDPLGHHEREEWLEPAPIPNSDPSSTVPSGMPLAPVNNYLTYRNSFHWDKDAYVAAGCTSTGGCDYTKARIRHFVHMSSSSIKGTAIESVKYPLENRIWYQYPGQSSSIYGGTFSKPIAIGRVLDDGTTQISRYSYDTGGFFNLTQTVDPAGRTTSYAYANQIDVAAISQTTEYGVQATIAQYVYNTNHRPLLYVDAAGQTSTYTYNTAGQLTSAINPLGQKTSYQYNSSGDLTEVTNANNQTAASYIYDSYDRVRTFTDSEGWTVTYDYDAADRVTKVTYPDGTSDQYAYEKLDLVSYRDREGRIWTYTYDADRRLISATDPLSDQTLFGYNGQSDLTSLTDAKHNVTQWAYDVQGRVMQKTYADSSALSYTYEHTTRRLASVLDALGQTKQYSYAIDDHLVGIGYLNAVNPTPNVTFAYNPYFPRLASTTDGTGTSQYAYYPIGTLGALRLEQESSPLPDSSIEYLYDELGRLIARTVAGQGPETFAYDAIGRLIGHESDIGAFTLAYLGQTGQITSRQLANSTLATSWSYLPNSGDRRLAELSNVGLSIGQHSAYQFTTTPENFITAIAETSDAATTYPSPGSQSASYNNVNQITDFSSQALTWSANGNLLSDGQRTYSWDAENRLVGIEYSAEPGKATSFAYDGLGRRTAITSTPAGGGAPVSASYIWCGSKICQARDASNALAREYHTEGELVAAVSPKIYYYGSDLIGSVRRVFASTSNAPAYGYDPYGVPLDATTPLTDFTFAGMFHNTDSGLDLTLYRAYDPVAGRWLSRDPLGERSDALANLYTYVGGNPVNLSDLNGLFSLLMGGGISAAAPTGAEGSGGVAVNPGLFGQEADIGVFGAGGATVGFNASADAFVGYVKGGIENVGGQTINQNIGIGPISITIFHHPTNGEVLGGTIGIGPGATPFGYSGAYESTGIYTLRDLISLWTGPCW